MNLIQLLIFFKLAVRFAFSVLARRAELLRTEISGIFFSSFSSFSSFFPIFPPSKLFFAELYTYGVCTNTTENFWANVLGESLVQIFGQIFWTIWTNFLDQFFGQFGPFFWTNFLDLFFGPTFWTNFLDQLF